MYVPFYTIILFADNQCHFSMSFQSNQTINNVQVRAAAATALGATGPADLVTDPLRAAALNDAHERVQWAAQLALSSLAE